MNAVAESLGCIQCLTPDQNGWAAGSKENGSSDRCRQNGCSNHCRRNGCSNHVVQECSPRRAWTEWTEWEWGGAVGSES